MVATQGATTGKTLEALTAIIIEIGRLPAVTTEASIVETVVETTVVILVVAAVVTSLTVGVDTDRLREVVPTLADIAAPAEVGQALEGNKKRVSIVSIQLVRVAVEVIGVTEAIEEIVAVMAVAVIVGAIEVVVAKAKAEAEATASLRMMITLALSPPGQIPRSSKRIMKI